MKSKGKKKQTIKIEDKSVIITKVIQAEMVTVSGPLPSYEWMCAAVDYIKMWSKGKTLTAN